MPYTQLPDENIRYKVFSWNKFYLIKSMFSSLKFLALGELLLNVQNPEVTPQLSPGRLARESGKPQPSVMLILGFAVGNRGSLAKPFHDQLPAAWKTGKNKKISSNPD